MRKALLYLHLWTGLMAAIFLLLLGVTGGLLAFEDEIDHVLNAKFAYVEPKLQSLTLRAISENLLARYPGAKIDAFALPPRPDLSLLVSLTDAKGKGWQLYIDPYTAEIIGSSGEANHFMRRVHSFHQRLAGGKVSDVIVGWTAIFLFLLAISGIVLWWRAKVFRIRRGTALRFTFELHNTVGILSSVFLFFFAWTAICIHWERKVNELAQRISPEAKYLGAAVPAPAGRPVNADEILNLGRSSLPEAKPTVLQMPRDEGNLAFVVMKFPEDHTPVGRSRVQIDAATGRVMRVQSSRRLTATMKYARMWNRELHTGDLFGLPTRILMALVSLALPLLAITGPLIWWFRRRVKAESKVAVP
ncbi:MAG TPA: PepSY-associated TM helix domain-containing protein [Terriglobales bacterium]|nr:PepSY-associated TM helix domain-containing protein [Terriglobales bacterium]